MLIVGLVIGYNNNYNCKKDRIYIWKNNNINTNYILYSWLSMEWSNWWISKIFL